MEQQKLRRHQHNLVISGMGVIVFSIWSFVKLCITLFLNPEEYNAIFNSAELNSLNESIYFIIIVKFLIFVTIIVLYGVIISLRVYIGRCANKEGHGIRKKNGKPRTAYIVFSIIILVSSLFNDYSLITDMLSLNYDLFDLLASLIVGLTSTYIFLQLIISAIVVRIAAHKEMKKAQEV